MADVADGGRQHPELDVEEYQEEHDAAQQPPAEPEQGQPRRQRDGKGQGLTVPQADADDEHDDEVDGRGPHQEGVPATRPGSGSFDGLHQPPP